MTERLTHRTRGGETRDRSRLTLRESFLMVSSIRSEAAGSHAEGSVHTEDWTVCEGPSCLKFSFSDLELCLASSTQEAPL